MCTDIRCLFELIEFRIIFYKSIFLAYCMTFGLITIYYNIIKDNKFINHSISKKKNEFIKHKLKLDKLIVQK